MEQLALFNALPREHRPRTILEAQLALSEAQADPRAPASECPCCGAVVKIYPRSIHAQMARWLIELARHTDRPPGILMGPDEGWIDQTTIPARGGDYGKLRHWGLVEHREKSAGDDRRTSGMWRITWSGWRFARGDVPVPRFAHVYRGSCLGYSAEQTTIRECLGERFSFADLWGGQ